CRYDIAANSTKTSRSDNGRHRQPPPHMTYPPLGHFKELSTNSGIEYQIPHEYEKRYYRIGVYAEIPEGE
ncbi:MAG: hypothetical protein RQ866_08800, partial [Bacteroidales bacterium]|nr:hypothetical protein [Bacteroidales bacterium]